MERGKVEQINKAKWYRIYTFSNKFFSLILISVVFSCIHCVFELLFCKRVCVFPSLISSAIGHCCKLVNKKVSSQL